MTDRSMSNRSLPFDCYLIICEKMKSVFVTTVAGSGEQKCVDGIGTAAALCSPEGICYSPADDALFIAERSSHRVRRLFPVTESRKTGLDRSLTAVLIETNALPVRPIVSMIVAYAIANSTSTAVDLACVFGLP